MPDLNTMQKNVSRATFLRQQIDVLEAADPDRGFLMGSEASKPLQRRIHPASLSAIYAAGRKVVLEEMRQEFLELCPPAE